MAKASDKHLVIVESPTKAKTIGRYLGKNYTVTASMGHVRDLPKGSIGVDTENGFSPEYTVMKGKQTIITELKKAAKGVATIYLATDPDREGEAISWHLLQAAGWKNIPIQRVVFHEITPDAIKEAFDHPREIDMQLVNAQQARRILDRLVGYQLSPLLWRKVQRGLSAGRVQSVALRLVVDRDREIEAFVPQEYWTLEVNLQTENSKSFTARLHGTTSTKERLELPNEGAVVAITGDLQGASYSVSNVTKREVKRRPSAPFITSTLQQESWRKLRFSARKTMQVAQQLYEGISVGSDGEVGLITYMRTDSTQVAASAVNETLTYIRKHYGTEYAPKEPRRYTSKSKGAQEAHEAIRPTGVARDPQALRAYLSNDQLRLYELIWKRMVASQMNDAILDQTQVQVEAPGRTGATYVFRASGSTVKFPGFRALYMEGVDDGSEEQEEVLPEITKGQALTCQELKPDQHFTQPPPRFTDASLIKLLEEHGIGRPSTYAPIISTLVDRQYTLRERGSLNSTRLGQVVSDQLTAHFPDIMNLDFTANLEEMLDKVASGEQEWVPLLTEFYGPFTEALEKAKEEMPRVKVEEPTDEICELCGRPMVIKRGRFGPFLSCSGFPECKNSKPIVQKTGALCPVDGGDLVQRKGKGRIFFGCSNYPNCTFTVTRRPLEPPCPVCGGLLVASGRDDAECVNHDYKGPVPEAEVAEAV
jgi:DNA topoisomerase-1